MRLRYLKRKYTRRLSYLWPPAWGGPYGLRDTPAVRREGVLVSVRRIGHQLLALQFFNDARRRWADVGLVLGDLESDDDAVDAGMTPAEVWAECLEDARGTLAHVCDATCPPDERRP